MKLILLDVDYIVIVQDFFPVDFSLDGVFNSALCAAHVVSGNQIGNAAVNKADADENICGGNGIKRVGADDDAEYSG